MFTTVSVYLVINSAHSEGSQQRSFLELPLPKQVPSRAKSETGKMYLQPLTVGPALGYKETRLVHFSSFWSILFKATTKQYS